MAGISPKSTGATRFPPPVAFVVGVAAGFFVQHFSPVPLLPAADAPYLRLAGIVLLVLGIGLSAFAIRTFRRAGTTVRPDCFSWFPQLRSSTIS
jgi:protein-S-isoprenylcysteine O-methyltransferase Ste14